MILVKNILKTICVRWWVHSFLFVKLQTVGKKIQNVQSEIILSFSRARYCCSTFVSHVFHWSLHLYISNTKNNLNIQAVTELYSSIEFSCKSHQIYLLIFLYWFNKSKRYWTDITSWKPWYFYIYVNWSAGNDLNYLKSIWCDLINLKTFSGHSPHCNHCIFHSYKCINTIYHFVNRIVDLCVNIRRD